MMDFLGNISVWFMNFIFSNKAKYYALMAVGLFLSFIAYHFLNNILSLLALVPYFKEVVTNNLLLFRICYVALIMSPTIIAYFIAIPSLFYIYQKEAYRAY